MCRSDYILNRFSDHYHDAWVTVPSHKKSVLGRMSETDNEDYANLVNTELVYLEEFQWTLDEYEMWCIVNNNTDYEFSTVYEISFYNSDGIMFESTQAYIPNIKPHSSYKVSEYISDSYQVAGFEWNNYYTEVIY